MIKIAKILCADLANLKITVRTKLQFKWRPALIRKSLYLTVLSGKKRAISLPSWANQDQASRER